MNGKIDQRLRVTLRQLEIFAATARSGSTRRAADLVSRTQSAASAALADLESSLGVKLFDRVAKRLVLNDNGRLLLPHVAEALDKVVEVEALFAAAHAPPLRLASSFTIGEYVLPPVISGWKREHPHGQVRLDIGNTNRVLEAVAAFDVDIGFIEGARTHPDLVVTHWLDDELVVVAAPESPWARKTLRESDLAQAMWIVREPGSGTREASDRWLLGALGRVTIEMELGSNEAVKRAVASGLGLGCLSRLVVQEAVAQGTLVEVKARLPVFSRAFSMVTHLSKPVGSSGATFLDHCKRPGVKKPAVRERARKLR